MIHLFSIFQTSDGHTLRRQAVAQKTWANQLWSECAVKDEQLPRLFKDGDRAFPFIKDLFDIGCRDKEGSEIIVFTNSDICVRSNCASVIAAELQDKDALYAFRRDFGHQLEKPIPDDDIPKGIFYQGTDLKAFRVDWWRMHCYDFPDMLLGNEAWDSVLRVLMEITHGGQNMGVPDLIYHERHASRWENLKNRYTVASQRHNLRLAYPWFLKHGLKPQSFGVRPV